MSECPQGRWGCDCMDEPEPSLVDRMSPLENHLYAVLGLIAVSDGRGAALLAKTSIADERILHILEEQEAAK